MDSRHDDDARPGAGGGSSATLLPLRIACAVGVADAVVALATALLSRPEPASVAIGLLWVLAWGSALARAPRLARAIARRPWTLVALGALAVAPAVLDGGYPGTLATQPMWIALVAASSAGWRVAVATGAAICAAKLAAFVATGTEPASLLPGAGEPSEATTAVLAPLAIALLGLAIVTALRRLLHAVEEAADPPPPPSAATAAAPALSPAEDAVVALLAAGLTPKQIAHQRGTSLATVRTQIKRAKRAAQARTLDELVAVAGSGR